MYIQPNMLKLIVTNWFYYIKFFELWSLSPSFSFPLTWKYRDINVVNNRGRRVYNNFLLLSNVNVAFAKIHGIHSFMAVYHHMQSFGYCLREYVATYTYTCKRLYALGCAKTVKGMI